ncbi:MAG: hypothetical protein ACI8ZB_004965 [Desulforhopalus sp.]|jgi:hypothetical protein
MKKTQNKTCNLCGKKKQLTSVNDAELCAACKSVAELIAKDPEQLHHLAKLSGVNQDTSTSQQPTQDLPDVLDGVRYRTTDRERNTWYVSVSELEGNPVEIFASTAFDRDHHLQSRISNLTTITRLISLILRHIFMAEPITLDKTLVQLQKSSRQPNDLPEMLGRILAKYSPDFKGFDNLNDV